MGLTRRMLDTPLRLKSERVRPSPTGGSHGCSRRRREQHTDESYLQSLPSLHSLDPLVSPCVWLQRASWKSQTLAMFRFGARFEEQCKSEGTANVKEEIHGDSAGVVTEAAAAQVITIPEKKAEP